MKCENCRHRLRLEKWDFTKIKEREWKFPQEGFLCNALADEGEAVWMIGVSGEWCEMWEPNPNRANWKYSEEYGYVCGNCGEPCAGTVMGKPRDKYCKMCGVKLTGVEE